MATVEEMRARHNALQEQVNALAAKYPSRSSDDWPSPLDRLHVRQLKTEQRQITAAINKAIAERDAEAVRMNRARPQRRSAPAAPAPKPKPAPSAHRSREDRLELIRSHGVPTDPAEFTYGEARDAALWAIEKRSNLSPASQDRLSELVRTRERGADGKLVARMVVTTDRPEYRSAWAKLMTGRTVFSAGEERALDEHARLQVDIERASQSDLARQLADARAHGRPDGSILRAMSESSTGSAGLPYDLDPSLIVTAGGVATAQILSYATQQMATSNLFHAFSAPSQGFVTQSEGSVATDETPTYVGTSINIWTARDWLPFSIEFGQDQPNMAENVAEQFQNAYNEFISSKSATGNGSSDIWGVFSRMNATTAGSGSAHVTCTTAGKLQAVDIRNVWAALGERYRTDPSCCWLMSPSVVSQVEALAAPSVANGLGLGPQELTISAETGVRRIYGRPVLEVDDAPSWTGTSGAAQILVVGAFRRYTIATRLGGFTAELVSWTPDQSTGRPSGNRGYLATARVGADVTDVAAFKILTNS